LAERNPVITAGSRIRLQLASDEWLVASMRRGDTAAFEALYERHAGELLSFCIYMLGSRQDGEDAVQATFISAYRALRADGRPISLRPWLFTIARNDCLSIIRRRRPVVELNGEVAPGPDPLGSLELREELRNVFEGLRELPENQRAALVLAEVHGLSQQEIGTVLGVRADQVKAFIYQARSKLVSERQARDVDCREIREELSTARGAALLRGRLRRHIRSCPDCRVYANGVARQRRQLGALLPVVPSLALKYRALEEALSIGAADPGSYVGPAAVGAGAAGAAAEFAGGGLNALLVKLAAGVACLGASAGVGVSVLNSPSESQGRAASAVSSSAQPPLSASLTSHGASASTALTTAGALTPAPAGQGGAAGPGSSPGAPGQPQGAAETTLDVTSPNSAGSGSSPNGEEGKQRSGGHGSEQVKGAKPAPGAKVEHPSEHGGPPPKTEQELKEKHEARERKLSEREPKIGSGSPPSEQRVKEKQEAREHRLSEREPKVGSGSPPSEQRLKEKREARERSLEKRRREREAETPAP
jgi:RNA polymerase sigma factor (sigma-70 family)